MFKNRALYVEMVKKSPTSPNTPSVPDEPTFDPEQINKLLTDQVRNVGMTVACVMAAGALLTTISEIVINKATK
jgi:hypothetical protein